MALTPQNRINISLSFFSLSKSYNFDLKHFLSKRHIFSNYYGVKVKMGHCIYLMIFHKDNTNFFK